jgi:hypothetical protein
MTRTGDDVLNIFLQFDDKETHSVDKLKNTTPCSRNLKFPPIFRLRKMARFLAAVLCGFLGCQTTPLLTEPMFPSSLETPVLPVADALLSQVEPILPVPPPQVIQSITFESDQLFLQLDDGTSHRYTMNPK